MWLELLPSCDTQRWGGQGPGWGDSDGTVYPYPVTIDTEFLAKPPVKWESGQAVRALFPNIEEDLTSF